MKRSSVRLGMLAVFLCCFIGTVSAAEPCFSTFDPEITGICITTVPSPGEGILMLGNRVVQPGDILTVEQARQVVFLPRPLSENRETALCYLPVTGEGTYPPETRKLLIRSRKNQAPIAEDSAAETYKNLENGGRLKVQEPESEPMTFTIIRQPRRGTVKINPDGSFVYTPKKNKVGTDSFVYTAADPAGNVSREATVTIEILKPTDAPRYVDTAGRSCRFAAEWMKHTGLFVGETLDGSPCFQPDRAVSRGEFLAVLVKALGISPEADLSVIGYTDDVPGWLRPYLAAAIRSGITAGLPNQESFGAQQGISGAEAAVMLQNALDFPVPPLEEASGPAPEALPTWAEPALSALAEKGFSIPADAVLNRSQAADLLYGIHQLIH